MKSREQREQELYSSGLVDAIKSIYRNTPNNISEKYFVLIADYLDSIGQLNYEDELHLDSVEIARRLPQVLNSISDANLNGIYGITNGKSIQMNIRNDYETNKLYFFHELTHAIQTRKVNNHEECSFYNGQTGMFLAEGATQYTAEIIYNNSNNDKLDYRNQPNTVRGQYNHTPYSPLSEYQLNGDILMLMSTSFSIPLNQILAMGFRADGRKQLKELYEAFPGQEGKFEEFMFDLEKIYSLDKLIIRGKINQISGQPQEIIMPTGQHFLGNLQIENELINKIERSLESNFIANNDERFIMKNYQKISMYLTSPELKREFQAVISQVAELVNNQTEISGNPTYK